MGYSQILACSSQEPEWIKFFFFFKANRAAPFSISGGLGQTTCFHLLVYFSQEGDQNIFSHALLLLPIHILYGKEEELETMPAQPPFSQPSHPTQ